MTTHTPRAISFSYEKRIFLSLCSALFALAVVYSYFVATSIAYTVERGEFIKKSERIVESVALLEREYLLRSNRMTERVAFDAGYVPVSERLYVERATLTFVNAR